MELLIYGHLHPTILFLLLFKFQYGATNILITRQMQTDITKFKFQYGATNISSFNKSDNPKQLFKFQYGATNMSI